jgi:hypothetical protein
MQATMRGVCIGAGLTPRVSDPKSILLPVARCNGAAQTVVAESPSFIIGSLKRAVVFTRRLHCTLFKGLYRP